MPSLVLSPALTREHREIDAVIEAFIEKLDCGSLQPEPLTAALEALRRHTYLARCVGQPLSASMVSGHCHRNQQATMMNR